MQGVLPPFITDKFALQVLNDLGGVASLPKITNYVKDHYDLSNFPHAIQYLSHQYRSLQAHGYLKSKKNKKEGDVELFFTDDAKPIIERMINE